MTDDDLRTALTKLAEKWLSNKEPSDYQDGVADAACAIRALLAAHPAPTPVFDTRREDVAQARADLARRARRAASVHTRYGRLRAADLLNTLADAVLAVLPAPPVVDEASIRERIAQDIEAEAERMILTSDAWTRGEERHLAGYSLAARIARGVTR